MQVQVHPGVGLHRPADTSARSTTRRGRSVRLRLHPAHGVAPGAMGAPQGGCGCRARVRHGGDACAGPRASAARAAAGRPAAGSARAPRGCRRRSPCRRAARLALTAARARGVSSLVVVTLAAAPRRRRWCTGDASWSASPGRSRIAGARSPVWAATGGAVGSLSPAGVGDVDEAARRPERRPRRRRRDWSWLPSRVTRPSQ